MRLDVESLRAFRTTVESGGVTRASELLCLSQSAVSHKIKRLENRVGKPLFLRRDGQMNLTDEGHSLFDYARRILALHDEAVLSLKSSSVKGELCLGATENITLSGLTPLLSRFAKAHPGVDLSVRVEQSLVLQNWLKQGRIDIALLQIEEDNVEADDLLLWRDELVWISAPDRDWNSYASLPLITFGPSCFYIPYIKQALDRAGLTFRTVLECPTHSGLYSAVGSGLGISVVNRHSMPDGVVELSCEVYGKLPGIAYVARLSGGQRSAAMDTLLQSLPELSGG
ncbi:MAG: LysR family transcriptional regulator [Amphritea sp.]|nr:LysR family transcriptional regulator [Amphritea sp.]